MIFTLLLLTSAEIFQRKSLLKDTHRENTLSYKTQAPTKSMNMDTWVIGTLNQLFRKGKSLKLKDVF